MTGLLVALVAGGLFLSPPVDPAPPAPDAVSITEWTVLWEKTRPRAGRRACPD